jgi:hypothetical protein
VRRSRRAAVLRHLADTLTEDEAELAVSYFKAQIVCRALVDLVDDNPKQYQYDTELQQVVLMAWHVAMRQLGKG